MMKTVHTHGVHYAVGSFRKVYNGSTQGAELLYIVSVGKVSQLVSNTKNGVAKRFYVSESVNI